MSNSRAHRAWLTTSALIGAAALSLSAAPSAWAQAHTYDIPSESLSQALRDYGRESGRQIIFTEDLVRGRTAPGVRGSYSADAALARLLAGTGLVSQLSPSGAIMIEREQAAAPTASTTVQEVVVTAEKREQNIQDVPAQVNVLTGAQLANMHSTSLQDMAGYIPGLTIQPQGSAGFETVTLDGIAPTGSTSTARVYIDETPLGSSSGFVDSASITPDLMPYDVDRVEVLQGPQGTLYGANAMSGLIKYVLTRPDLTSFSAKAGVDVFVIADGGGAGEQLRGAVNLPLVQDQLAARLSVYQDYTPGYIDDVLTGWKNDNASRQVGGRLSLLWEPTSTLSIQGTALYQYTQQSNVDVVQYDPVTHQPFPGGGALSNIYSLPQSASSRLNLYDLTVKWDLGWANLTSSSSYQSFNSVLNLDGTAEDSSLIDLLFGVPTSKVAEFENPEVNKFTQEIRLASPSSHNRLEWMFGGYFTHETTTQTQNLFAVDTPGVGDLGFDGLDSTYTEYAGFGNLTWHATDRLDLSGGVRYAYNDQHFVSPQGGPLFGGAAVTESNSHQGVVTWDVNPSYHFDAHNMVYVRIATGYEPGGPTGGAIGVPTAPQSYAASTLIDYSAGLKSTWFDGKAVFDLSVFDIDWKNLQVPVAYPTCPCTLIGNAGTARSVGTTFNGTYSPIAGLRFGASVTYTDATATAPIPSLGTPAGERLPYVPLWAWSLTADDIIPISDTWKFDVGLGYRHGGRSWSLVQGENSGGLALSFFDPSYDVLDLHAAVTNGSWRFSLYAKNVTNALYLRGEGLETDAFLNPVALTGNISQPRIIGVSVDKSF